MAHEIFKQIRTGNIFSDTYLVKNGGRPSKLNIRQIHSFINDGLGCIKLSSNILTDFEQFEMYLYAKKQIDFNHLTPGQISLKVAELEKKFGPYELD